MFAQLRDWLDDLPLNDPIERRQAAVLQIFLLGMLLLSLLALLPSFFTNIAARPAEIIPALAPLVFLLCMAGALVLLRRGRFEPAVLLGTIGFILGHSLAVYALGIRNGTALLILFMVPLTLAGLLGGWRILLAAAGLNVAIAVLVATLENLSPPLAGFVFPATASGVPVNDPTVPAVVLFILVTAVLAVFFRRFGRALRDALTQSLAREQQLDQLRATLETSVAERTAELRAALDEARAATNAQARLLAENMEQRAALRDMSVPVLPVDAQTLVMPLVGTLDDARLRDLQAQALRAIERTSAHQILLDITGVPVVDSHVAQGLLSVVQAARLLGAEAALIGISPEVAQAIVGLGLDLRGVRTYTDLQTALVGVGGFGEEHGQ